MSEHEHDWVPVALVERRVPVGARRCSAVKRVRLLEVPEIGEENQGG